MDLPNPERHSFRMPDADALKAAFPAHKPRILLFHGSNRQRSYSRF